jgi:hypothetical protein
MAAIASIRDGLKTRLATISGLRTHDTAPSQINPPSAVVVPGDPAIRYDSTMARGSDDYLFMVHLFVSFAVDRTAQDKLDGYLSGSGATSVKAAIEADETLGGVAHFTRVKEVREYGEKDYGDQRYLQAVFVVEVTASGT